MTATTVNASAILRPEQVAELLVAPVEHMSIAAQVATVVSTTSHDFRIPIVAADPSASWVAEGEEIPVSDGNLDEIVVTPAKLAGLTIISRELANDSSPAASEAVGNGIARDLARKLDEAFVGNLAAPAPKGLKSLTGVTAVAAPAAWANTDPFIEAIYAAEGVNATLTAWIANPVDARALAMVKESTGSNKALLGPDSTEAGRRQIAGVPVFTSPYLAEGTVYGIDQSSVFVVIREDAEVTTDSSVYFSSDRIAVRGILRVGLAYPHPAGVVKITRAAA